MNHRLRSALKWTGVVFAGFIVVVALTLLFVDWSAMKGPIERFASARSGREVTINGPLTLHVWSLTPRLSVQGLVIGNPPWDKGPPMLRMERLEVEIKLLPLLKGDVILPRLQLIRPEISLRRDGEGKANWTFSSTRPTNAKAAPPPKLPVVRSFLIQDGVLTVQDDLLHLKLRGGLRAHEKAAEKDDKAFRIDGEGTLNKRPFAMRIAGGPLVNLDPDQPYPFELSIKAGNLRVQSAGSVDKPFDLGKFKLWVRTSGGDLADLYYLTQLALPNTPPFKLSARVDRDASIIKVKQLQGTLGRSDVRGELTVDVSHERPLLTGTLRSERLRLRDLGPSFGAEPEAPGSLQDTKEPPKPSKKGAMTTPPADAKLFPDARLQVERVRATNADVRFSAQSIEGRVPLKEVSLHVKLQDGVLAVAPFELVLPQGKVRGTARIDANGMTPHGKVEMRMQEVLLDQFKGKAPDAKAPLGGIMQAHLALTGHGDSVHDFMADADGRLSIVLPHGEIRAAFAELTGINMARGLGLLMKGDEERTDIRCGIAHFEVKGGVMTANRFVIDTEKVRITGLGEIRLGPEELDLSIKGEPKELRFARLRTPVEVNGHLRKPSIGINAGKTLKQGAIATAMGVVLTPLAAIVAFIDPGLAKDENCSKLLAEAK